MLWAIANAISFQVAVQAFSWTKLWKIVYLQIKFGRNLIIGRNSEIWRRQLLHFTYNHLTFRSLSLSSFFFILLLFAFNCKHSALTTPTSKPSTRIISNQIKLPFTFIDSLTFDPILFHFQVTYCQLYGAHNWLYSNNNKSSNFISRIDYHSAASHHHHDWRTSPSN